MGRILDNPPKCPSCSKILDGFTGIHTKALPKVGDYSICLSCEAILRWVERFSLELAPKVDIPDNVQKLCDDLIEMKREGKESWR